MREFSGVCPQGGGVPPSLIFQIFYEMKLIVENDRLRKDETTNYYYFRVGVEVSNTYIFTFNTGWRRWVPQIDAFSLFPLPWGESTTVVGCSKCKPGFSRVGGICPCYIIMTINTTGGPALITPNPHRFPRKRAIAQMEACKPPGFACRPGFLNGSVAQIRQVKKEEGHFEATETAGESFHIPLLLLLLLHLLLSLGPFDVCLVEHILDRGVAFEESLDNFVLVPWDFTVNGSCHFDTVLRGVFIT